MPIFSPQHIMFHIGILKNRIIPHGCLWPEADIWCALAPKFEDRYTPVPEHCLLRYASLHDISIIRFLFLTYKIRKNYMPREMQKMKLPERRKNEPVRNANIIMTSPSCKSHDNIIAHTQPGDLHVMNILTLSFILTIILVQRTRGSNHLVSHLVLTL